MTTIRMSRQVEDFAIFGAKAVIMGDHIGPVTPNWREIPRWWRAEGRSRHMSRQGSASAREVDVAVATLEAILEAKPLKRL